MASILVVDDETSMREFLEILLAKDGHQVAAAADVAAALRAVGEGVVDLVLTDLRLGGEDGMEVLRGVKQSSPATEVVMMTAFASTENAIQAMKLGAHDYLIKPFKVDELRLVVQKALEHRALLQENRVLRHRVGERRSAGGDAILGKAPVVEEVRALVGKVAPTRTTVLITGESGTGKEVVARAIHLQGPRAEQPFVAVNCGAIPEGLLESEFFGHQKGAFTGAAEARLGLFEVAGSGTLFLDEIGELPQALQVKLLRALQERRIRRVGGTSDVAISARIVAATNRDLAEEVKAGRFREDLYYRLNVIQIRLPPLRERREDLPEFCRHFVERFAADLGRSVPRVSPEAEQLLKAHAWPGNLRELANVLERAVTLAPGDLIRPEDLPATLRQRSGDPGQAAGLPDLSDLPPEGMDLQAHLDGIERRILEQALDRAGGVKTEAARLLAMTFRSFRYRLQKFGIGGGEA